MSFTKEQLTAKIAALRKQETPSAQNPNGPVRRVLFFGSEEDRGYEIHFRKYFSSFHFMPFYGEFESLGKLTQSLKSRGITSVVFTNSDLLESLVEDLGESPSTPKINDYAGSLFNKDGIEFLAVYPLKQLVTVPYGAFVIEKFCSKITRPEKWTALPKFKWGVLDQSNAETFYSHFHSAFLITYDIETKRENHKIDIISFTGVFVEEGKLTTVTIVLELKDAWSLHWMRKFLTIAVPKGTQNGKYDNFYLLRFNSPPTYWEFDSKYLLHSWYAELPKDLGFLNAFFLRDVVYWKDLSETNDRKEYFRYCAMDSWATALVILEEIDQMPSWAKRNYLLKFRLQFPSILCEHTGLVRDMERLHSIRKEMDEKRDILLARLRKITNTPTFNPGSHVQVKNLMRLLGCEELATSSDETHLLKAGLTHPLNKRIFDMLLEIRGLNKLISTYLRTDDDMDKKGEGGGKEYLGQVLYSLNPDGTESGRNSSRESSMWCGIQIQNIPAKYPQPKQTIRAPEGFFLAEADLEQAESRDTAYITGDKTLITAVTEKGDFHSYNASNFFGVPYEEIYDEKTGKKLRKDLRTLAKPINHGANYNMGPEVMVDNMGTPMVWQAKSLLNLPFNNPTEVTEYLLIRFHQTYPTLRGIIKFRSNAVRKFVGLPVNQYKLYAPGTYYEWVANNVQHRSMLTSRAYHHTEYNLKKHPDSTAYIQDGDWTRYCFGKPWQNKLDLNSYVAHCPQSLNARTLDEAFMQVFYKVALPNPTDFRLFAQIHDSILHGFKKGRHDLSEQVRQLMEIPVTIRSIHGDVRTFTVPAALKAGKTGQGVEYWSDTE